MTSHSGCHPQSHVQDCSAGLNSARRVLVAVASLLTPFISSGPSLEHFLTSHKIPAPPPPAYSHEEQLRNSDKSFLHDSCNASEEKSKHTAGTLDGLMICDSEIISHYHT